MAKPLRRPYPTDLSDEQWVLIKPLIPAFKPGDRPLKIERREIVNAVLYVARAGCAWRLLPHDFPDWQLVYHYFNEWSKEGIWKQIHEALHKAVRKHVGRNPTASAGVIDAQSVKTTERGGVHGYDGYKKVNGRKRHILTDTMGILIALHIFAANLQERADTFKIVEEAQVSSPKLAYVWADQGYRSQDGHKKVQDKLGVHIEVVGERRPTGIWWPKDEPLPEHLAKMFEPGIRMQKRRWVAERTFGWFGRYRRLSKDYEFKMQNSESMIWLAMANNLARRLT